MTQNSTVLLLVAVLTYCPSKTCSTYQYDDDFSFVQKHPQELFCEADFVVVARVLDTKSTLLLMNATGRNNSSGTLSHRPPPTHTNVILVKVKRVFKGRSLVREGSTVELVSSLIPTVLAIVPRQSYLFSGFVHQANVPVPVPEDHGHCDGLLYSGRHVFVENQLNVMSGCSWFQPRLLLTRQQKQGLVGVYARGCTCPIVKCHGQPDDPRRYCLGDIKRALFGEGCVMHYGNEEIAVRRLTCSHSLDDDVTCKWRQCSSRKMPCTPGNSTK